IRDFLKDGGGLVVLGGAPFHQPVRAGTTPNEFTRMQRQPTFAHELLIGPAVAISLDGGRVVATEDGRFPADAAALERPKTAFALTVRFATSKSFPDQDGSAGPRDALLRPLVHV